MTIWIHDDCSSSDIEDLGFSFFNSFPVKCKYCGSSMVRRDIQDLWGKSSDDYILRHSRLLNFRWLVEEQGVALNDLELHDGDPGCDVYCDVLICYGCGWWVVVKRSLLCSKSSQMWEMIYGTCGSLRNLDLADISVPVNEIRAYLTAKYNDRFIVHPRKFEEVVASAFRGLGYETELTAYSNDGGIDVIMYGPDGKKIGVQVKRHRGKISVEQIRSFLGALIVNGCVKGYFVTSSSYQSGAHDLADQCGKYYRPIGLIEASEFFKILQVSSLEELSEDYPFDSLKYIPELKLLADLNLNSL